MFLRYGLTLALFLLPALADAEDTVKVKRVTFRDGHATIKGAIKGYATADYVFPAGAGESIRVRFKSSNGGGYFNLLAPGETEAAFFIGSTSGDSYEGAAPASGDYTARVYLMRSAARRGETARYMLDIALGQTSATNEKGPDFADGLTGGPDYWEVTGVATGDSLKIRETPSPKGKLVASVSNGAALKNRGCKNMRGQRWCQVTTDAGARGWVNGKYLREGAGLH